MPYTRYTVWLHAKTSKHEGDQSETLSFRTDVGGPGAPQLTNASCRADTSLLVRWRRPRHLSGAIDFYYVRYRGEFEPDLRQLRVDTDAEVKENQVGFNVVLRCMRFCILNTCHGVKSYILGEKKKTGTSCSHIHAPVKTSYPRCIIQEVF